MHNWPHHVCLLKWEKLLGSRGSHEGEQNQKWLHYHGLVWGPLGCIATPPLRSREPQKEVTKSEVATSHLLSGGGSMSGIVSNTVRSRGSLEKGAK